MDNDSPAKSRSVFSVFGGIFKLTFVVLTLGLVIAGGFLIGGFMKFTDTVTSYNIDGVPHNASAIVVYTGGTSRINEAIKLLKDRKGTRLLISGVHQKTSKESLKTRYHIDNYLFDCCIDIDKQAANTHGNAVETGKWTIANKFDSLIIVTSTYHMPRSLLETSRLLPKVNLIPFPVPATNFDNENWYKDRESLSLLLSEYSKYVATQFEPVLAEGTIDTIRAGLASF